MSITILTGNMIKLGKELKRIMTFMRIIDHFIIIAITNNCEFITIFIVIFVYANV